jgi:hypothetical protein
MGHIKKFCPQLMSESGHEHTRQGKSDEQFAGVSETPQVLVATVEQEEPVEALHAANDADITRSWVLDSGATAHITRDLGMLDDVRPAPAGTYVRFGNGRKAKVTVMGAVNIHIKVMGRVEWLQLSDVLYSAEVTRNLPSTLCLTSKGAEVSVFKDRGLQLILLQLILSLMGKYWPNYRKPADYLCSMKQICSGRKGIKPSSVS